MVAAKVAPRQTLPGSPPRRWLAEASERQKPLPSAAIVHGPPGIGKTSLAAFVPGVVFLMDDKERGVLQLRDAGLIPDVPAIPPVSTFAEAMDVLRQLAEEEHSYRALALDALGGFERLCHEEVCRRDFSNDWTDRGFMGYMRGYEVALADWRAFLSALDRLRTERSMSVMLLGHTRVTPFKNPSGPDYDRYTVDVHHKTWSLTHKWADMVLFANYEVAFDSRDANKVKAKAKGGQTRMLYTEHCAAYDAKNRHGLPPEIEMGDSGAEAWNNLSAALKAGRKAVAA